MLVDLLVLEKKNSWGFDVDLRVQRQKGGKCFGSLQKNVSPSMKGCSKSQEQTLGRKAEHGSSHTTPQQGEKAHPQKVTPAT